LAAPHAFDPASFDPRRAALCRRSCGPKRDAIRAATHDLMTGRPRDHFPQHIDFAFSELNSDDRALIQRKVMNGDF
jgi:hypothetical protein